MPSDSRPVSTRNEVALPLFLGSRLHRVGHKLPDLAAQDVVTFLCLIIVFVNQVFTFGPHCRSWSCDRPGGATLHVVVGFDAGTLELVLDVALLSLCVGRTIVPSLLLDLLLLSLNFLDEFLWRYSYDRLGHLLVESTGVNFLLVVLILLVNYSLDVDPQSARFNFGLRSRLLLNGRLHLPKRWGDIGLRLPDWGLLSLLLYKDLVVLLDKDLVEY